MRSYCLGTDELRRFIEIELDGKSYFDDELYLRSIIENWHCWDTELVLLATTLSQHLERVIKAGADAQSVLSWIMMRSSDTLLTLEGFGDSFVTYMLSQSRHDGITIEDELIRIKQLQLERWY